MRFLYNFLTYLLLIPLAVYWISRGIVNRSYRDRLMQRFGFGFPKLQDSIWIHAVSVGEVQAAVPLIHVLMQRFPLQKIIVTTVTPTGASRVVELFGEAVVHCYMPFEFPNAIRSFFTSVKPRVAMIMETEIWPNLYRGCGVRSIPLILVSARISPKSIPGYRRLVPLIRETLSHGIIIAAQSQADASRFLELGADPERTHVTGNIKFDIEFDQAIVSRGKQLRSALFACRPVWIAASTHRGEEQQVLEAHRILLKAHPDLLLVLVPRHPERFTEVRELIEKSSFTVVSRTSDQPATASTEVFLVNTMGEVPLFFAASDISFIGGSLVPIGGHNLLEPAIQELPIITGLYLFNTEEIAENFVKHDACVVVANGVELAAAVLVLLDDPDEATKMGKRGLKVVEQNSGSLQRLLVLLEPLLNSQAID
ncbi:MAG: lipid IV(A) 3-deoxy-D-manno-octulosonic acid transferase [Woeseiaceae bacterium]|nr:lipid IV(A) 3-deoxy-D-manno-octulosonic acid transferase [Woeseiaceae bacterium]